MARRVALPRSFFDRDARAVAPELLNKLLVGTVGGVRVEARLVEVEAYCGADDAGSHAYRRQTARNATMFGAPGSLYVYFSYGMHWCMNAVCGPGAQPHAVLLRAASPVSGIDAMYERRPAARRDRELCSGPGKLGAAFAVDRSLDGTNLRSGPVRVVDDGVAPPARPATSVRIGLGSGKGDAHPWRFYVAGDANLSARPRPARRS